MADASETERRRAAKAAFKAAERSENQRQMVLTADQLDALLDVLDEALSETPCDHSLRHTLRWADATGIDRETLRDSLAQFGGYCDCEVVANVDPEAIG